MFWLLYFATAVVHAQNLITTEAGGGGQITYSETLLTPTVTVGGTAGTILYSGLAPSLVGVYQVNAVVPLVPGHGTQVILSVGGASATASYTNPSAVGLGNANTLVVNLDQLL
jgi:uncharacterized protein (TIGR03437 family)